MKKILVIEGSPRQGNTSTVTDWVLSGLGRGMRVERIRAAELNIHGCRECLGCESTKEAAGCRQDDDMLEIYDKMVDADLTVFTTPVFCWGATAQLKAVLDRCFALLTGEGLLKGSKWALVITAGGDHYDGADLIVSMFKNLCRFAGIKFLGQHVVANCPSGGSLKRNKALAQQARAYGKELAKALEAR